MDALSLAYLVKNTYGKLQHLEKFEDAKATTTSGTSTPASVTPNPAPSKSSGGIFGFIFMSIFILLFGGYAAYLSWFANSLINWQTGWKIFFSFFAFLSGFSYLIAYLIHKLDLLNYIRRSNNEVI